MYRFLQLPPHSRYKTIPSPQGCHTTLYSHIPLHLLSYLECLATTHHLSISIVLSLGFTQSLLPLILCAFVNVNILNNNTFKNISETNFTLSNLVKLTTLSEFSCGLTNFGNFKPMSSFKMPDENVDSNKCNTN